MLFRTWKREGEYVKVALNIFTHSDGELPVTNLDIFCLLVKPVSIVQPSDLLSCKSSQVRRSKNTFNLFLNALTLSYVGLAVKEDTIPRRSNPEEAR